MAKSKHRKSKEQRAEMKAQELNQTTNVNEAPNSVNEENVATEDANKTPTADVDIPKFVEKQNKKMEKMTKDGKEIEKSLEKYSVPKFLVAIVTLLILVLIFGLIVSNKNTAKEDVTTVSLSSEVTEMFNESDLNKLADASSVSLDDLTNFLTSDTLGSVGAEMPSIELQKYNSEETINLADYKGKKVIFEVIADWCSYCQEMSKEYLDDIIEANPDITFIQYMQSGVKEEVEAFYETINKEPNENLIIVYTSEEMNSWLEQHSFDSYPSFYLFNEDGLLAGREVGLLSADSFVKKFMPIVYNQTLPLYELKTTNGQTIAEAIQYKNIAYEYMNQLTEIDVPNSFIKEKLGLNED